MPVFEYERSKLDRRWVLGNSAMTAATTCKQKVGDIPTNLLFLDPAPPPPRHTWSKLSLSTFLGHDFAVLGLNFLIFSAAFSWYCNFAKVHRNHVFFSFSNRDFRSAATFSFGFALRPTLTNAVISLDSPDRFFSAFNHGSFRSGSPATNLACFSKKKVPILSIFF